MTALPSSRMPRIASHVFPLGALLITSNTSPTLDMLLSLGAIRLESLPPRRGGWVRAVYERSLGIALVLLFLMSFGLHFWGSLDAANAEALLHGHPLQCATEYLADSRFWFESFQNW